MEHAPCKSSVDVDLSMVKGFWLVKCQINFYYETHFEKDLNGKYLKNMVHECCQFLQTIREHQLGIRE